MTSRTFPSRTIFSVALVIGLMLPDASRLYAQPTVSTLPSWDGVSGAPLLTRDFSAASVGQTFTTPSNALALNGASLFMGYSPIFFPFDQDLRFHAYLFGWNGSTLTDLLWSSPVQDGATDIPLAERAFDVGSVPLAAGGRYAVVLSTLEVDPFDPGLAFVSMFPAYQNVGLVDADAYTGGALIQSFANSWADLQTSPWFVEQSSDLAIELRFAPRVDVVVPEPSTLPLLAAAFGLFVLLAARRASRRNAR